MLTLVDRFSKVTKTSQQYNCSLACDSTSKLWLHAAVYRSFPFFRHKILETMNPNFINIRVSNELSVTQWCTNNSIDHKSIKSSLSVFYFIFGHQQLASIHTIWSKQISDSTPHTPSNSSIRVHKTILDFAKWSSTHLPSFAFG